MKRVIKFRVFDKEVNKMRSWEDIQYDRDAGALISGEYAAYYHLMQFTGLTDANGVEIYEGDIVSYNDGTVEREIGVVVWEEEIPGFFVTEIPYFPGELPFPNEKMEVIGNIYQNPELLIK